MTTYYAAIGSDRMAVYGIGATEAEALADARRGEASGEYEIVPCTTAAAGYIEQCGGQPSTRVTVSRSGVSLRVEEEIASLSASDLRAEALAAAGRGETIRVERRPHHANPSITVETLIIEAPGGASGDIGRAGQVTNGDAVWGDYDPESDTIALDGEDGTVVDFTGREV